MNSYRATARLAADPELRELPDGRHVCKLRVAVKGLARGEEVGYLDVSCFGAPGEAAARVLRKGWLVLLDGRLSYREREVEGAPRRREWEVIGNVEFLAPPRSERAEDSERSDAVAA